MTTSSARIAFAALLGLTVVATAVQEILPSVARAEEPPQRPAETRPSAGSAAGSAAAPGAGSAVAPGAGSAAVPGAGSAERPRPELPGAGSAERARPQLPEPPPPPHAATPPSSSLPTPGVNPAENLPPDQLSPVTTDELFVDPDEMVEGTNVHLENLIVRAKSGLLARVSDGRNEIFVAPVDPSWLEFIAIGAHVDVRGTLVDTPTARQAKLVFAMNAREARRLARTPVYVDAWSLTTR